uniref:Uncharacterized protein n=1 Tax=Euplotes vanleeuwenhoeki TaxID=2794224 RepID=A0A7T1C551_9SPIT|nr:hypothetical protein KQ443_mgp32 [Euplotes vanleeuwenhoeki]QPM99246.1 hypothetical protein MitoLV_15 [Euplotes vanleeuwenhoeki]
MFFFFTKSIKYLDDGITYPNVRYFLKSPARVIASRFFKKNLMFKTIFFLKSYIHLKFSHSNKNTYVTLSHKSLAYLYTNFTISYGIMLNFFRKKFGTDTPKPKLIRAVSALLFKLVKRIRFRGLCISIDRWFSGLNYILNGLITTLKFFSIVFKPKWIFGYIIRKRHRRLKKKLVKKIFV